MQVYVSKISRTYEPRTDSILLFQVPMMATIEFTKKKRTKEESNHPEVDIGNGNINETNERVDGRPERSRRQPAWARPGEYDLARD